MALRVKDNADINRIIESVKALSENKVLVGFPDTTAGRNDGPITNASIAYVQNFGSPKQNIPAREFMESGLLSARDDLVDRLKIAADYAMKGNKEATIKSLHKVGLVAQAAIRNKITTGPFLPLSPITLAARRARGRKGIKPLLDTGQLRRAVNYVLRGKWF